jgi:hypothetical protein
MPRPSLLAFAIALLSLAPACVTRPPPIKSPPVAPESAPAGDGECTVSHGIDPSGNPGCSTGCTWNAAQKRCMPDKPPGWVPPDGT